MLLNTIRYTLKRQAHALKLRDAVPLHRRILRAGRCSKWSFAYLLLYNRIFLVPTKIMGSDESTLAYHVVLHTKVVHEAVKSRLCKKYHLLFHT